MRRIVPFIIAAALLATPAAAQDWEQYYNLDTDAAGRQVLTVDPSVPRGTPGRYERLPLPPVSSRLVYVATAFEETVNEPEGVYLLNVSVAGAESLPVGSLVLLPKLPPGTATGNVVLTFAGGGATLRLRTNTGDGVTWANLRDHELHIAIVAEQSWISLH